LIGERADSPVEKRPLLQHREAESASRRSHPRADFRRVWADLRLRWSEGSPRTSNETGRRSFLPV
jgi:hypothetical protein